MYQLNICDCVLYSYLVKNVLVLPDPEAPSRLKEFWVEFAPPTLQLLFIFVQYCVPFVCFDG
jgi:hypothetical protein